MVNRVEALGPSLKDLRKSQEVTIFDASEAMESSTHATQISAWESGRIKPGAVKIVETLGVYDYVMVFMHKDEAARLVADRMRPRDDT